MKKVVVIGSSNTDMVVKSARIPVPGETILGGRFMMNPGGKEPTRLSPPPAWDEMSHLLPRSEMICSAKKPKRSGRRRRFIPIMC